MPLLVSVSGIRGVVGDGLTPELVLRVAQAYGSWLGGGKVVLGRDSRVTGEMLRGAVISGLMAVGCDVVDLGICPTPTTEIATERHGDGGIIITASHNPIEWNALKLLAPDGLFLDEDQGREVMRRMESGDFRFARWDGIGKLSHYTGAVKEHVAEILNLPFLNVREIRRRRFRVVADCVNGAGGVILPYLLERLGCEYEILHEEANGLFPRKPEPLPEHLGELGEAVKAFGADFGLAVDPDVDRLALVDENGRPLGEEYTLALAADFVLSKRPGPVVVNASTTRAIDDLAARYGASVIRTKVGEIHVAKKAREVNATIAGEGNGGVILPDVHLGRDAPVGLALVLQGLLEKNEPISAWYAGLPQYFMVKDRIEVGTVSAAEIVERYRESLSGASVDLTDGVKVLLGNAWVQVRPSNTEPIIRVMAEAPTPEEARRLADEHLAILRNLLVGRKGAAS